MDDSKHSYKKVSFQICGKQYYARAWISILDLELIESSSVEKNPNYDLLVAQILHSHILAEEEEKPDLESIVSEGPILFSQYIKSVLKNEPGFNEYYEKNAKISSLSERFIKSIVDYHLQVVKRISNIEYPKINLQMPVSNGLKLAANQRSSLSMNNLPAIKGVLDQTKSTLIEVLEPLKNSASDLAFKQIRESIIAYQNAMAPIITQLKEAISSLRIPGYSKEELDQIQSALEKWGDLGWTVPPSGDWDLFFQEPPDYDTANKLAMKYCDNKEMKALFRETESMRRVKKVDYNEAVFDYENGKYKSCALILFSLIDSSFIRRQHKEDRDSKGDRAVGKRAINNWRTRSKNEKKTDMSLTEVFMYSNLFSALLTFFEYGEDFRESKKVINRNYLDHGMWKKPVRKRDCVQLFLAYYNLLQLFELTI